MQLRVTHCTEQNSITPYISPKCSATCRCVSTWLRWEKWSAWGQGQGGIWTWLKWKLNGFSHPGFSKEVPPRKATDFSFANIDEQAGHKGLYLKQRFSWMTQLLVDENNSQPSQTDGFTVHSEAGKSSNRNPYSLIPDSPLCTPPNLCPKQNKSSKVMTTRY